MIKFISIIILLIPCVSYAYDLTTKDGIKACKNDPACFVCADATIGQVGQCTMLPTYDIAINAANNAVLNNLCPLNSGKRQCVIKEEVITSTDTTSGSAGERTFFNVTVTNHGNRLSFKESYCYLNRFQIGDGGEAANWKCDDILYSLPTDLFEIPTNKEVTKSTVKLTNSGITHTVELNQTITISQPCHAIMQGIYGESSYLSCRTPQCSSKEVCTGGGGDDGIYCTTEWTCDNNYNISFDAELTSTTKRYDQVCPENSSAPCIQDKGVFYCNIKDCLQGKDIEISDSDMTEDDLSDNSSAGQKTCSLTEPSLFAGQYMSCRLQSTTNLLAR